MTAIFEFDNQYARLPSRFYARTNPAAVSSPSLIRVNEQLAENLGLEVALLGSPEAINAFAGNEVPAGAEPLAMAYAGHQFGGWVPQLGDGRALLLGEVIDKNGVRQDIQLKGSGQTPFSRNGDGLSPIGPVLREYAVSEAMAALGVPTTRSLAAVATGDTVYRERVQPGGVLTRVSRSHIRVGTFQFFAARKDNDALRALADHVIERHYPEASEQPNRYLALLSAVIRKQAELIARWQLLGFIHGVMNTDNMLICGDTIDYGPCAFMDAFDADKVFSSIDHGGRYRYRNQPAIAQWNLTRFAETLLPILADDIDTAVPMAQQAVEQFAADFEQVYRSGAAHKLGLSEAQEGDVQLFDDLLAWMQEEKADFTLTFRNLSDLAAETDSPSPATVSAIYQFPDSIRPWMTRWQQRVQTETPDPGERQKSMYRHNPAIIPRNHLVEKAIDDATEHNDYAFFHRLVEVTARPWEYSAEVESFAKPPQPDEIVYQTFCGT